MNMDTIAHLKLTSRISENITKGAGRRMGKKFPTRSEDLKKYLNELESVQKMTLVILMKNGS